jgi:hypothetical protein
MSISSLAGKLHMKPGMRLLISTPPFDYLQKLEPLPEKVTISLKTDATYPFVQVFVTRLAQIASVVRKLEKHAGPHALVWIAYPKKTSDVKTDLTRDQLRKTMSAMGWRAVSIVAIDETWAALRFRPVAQMHARPRPRAA